MKNNYYLKVVHSAKGSTWEEHKYVKRIDGTYYYPKGYEGGRTVDTLKKQEEEGTAPEYTDEDIDALAMEVIRGNFANGEERKALLGDIYQKVQDKVNIIMRSSGSSNKINEKQSEKSEKTESKGKRAVEAANEALKTRETSRSKKGPDMSKIYSIYDKKNKEAKHGIMDDPNHIEHYGVLGMKWGVRRYQNADGTLTDAGRRRLGRTSSGERTGDRAASERDLHPEDRQRRIRSEIHGQVSSDYEQASRIAKSGSEASRSAANIARTRETMARKKDQKSIDVSNFTTKELNDMIARMSAENNYQRLVAERSSEGKIYASDILSMVGDIAAVGASAATIAAAIYRLRS